MDSPRPWAETRALWRPLVLKYRDEQRLRDYFRRIAKEIPEPPKGWETLDRPCRWAKMLEEEKQKENASR
jgi:hypothetical protein